MAKKTRSDMVRRGTRYLIERSAEGSFSKWIPVGKTKKASAKKSSAKKASARTSTTNRAARR